MSSTALLLIVMTLAVEFPGNNAHPAQHVWPKECEGRSYCDKKPTYYPEETINKLLANVSLKYVLGDLERRDGINDNDVGRCTKIREVRKIYLIKDENDTIRFVAQSKTFEIDIVVEECTNPGRVNYAPWLIKNELKRQRVDCTETTEMFQFPVLALDHKTLDSVAPKDGISLSCSAKVLKK